MTQKECMEYLQEHGEATAPEIANESSSSKKSILTNLKSLSKTRLVDKEIPDDGSQAHRFVLTDKGLNADPDSFGGMVV